jgi:cytochrome c553
LTPMKLTIALLFVLLMTTTAAHAAGDPVRGNELRHECIDCHGEDGMGDEEYPPIAGLDENYILEQLIAFKTGERPNPAEMMLWTLEDLDEQDLEDLAAYYAAQNKD